jgi:hypothetical protein
MAEIPSIPESLDPNSGQENGDALRKNQNATGYESVRHQHAEAVRKLAKQSSEQEAKDRAEAEVISQTLMSGVDGAHIPTKLERSAAEIAPETDVKVTRALRKAAVAAIGDAVPNAREIVNTLAEIEQGGARLQEISKNGAAATAALKNLPDGADGAAIIAALDGMKAAGKAKDSVSEDRYAAETDAMLKRLETLNPSFAQRANAEYERYAAEQKTENAERAAQGQPAAEPLDRRAYVVGAYVAAMSTGAFIGGVAESDRAEAAALVARLHDANREGVARFLRDVAPGTNHAMLANAVAAHAKAAGVDVNTDGAEPAGERVDNGRLVKLSRKGDTTVESWPDGKTVYRAIDGRRVEADDGTITSYAPDGRRVSRTNEGNPSVCYLGDISLPLSIAGKSPDDIIRAADAVAQWESFFKRSGFGFLTATDWQAIERAATIAGNGRTGALAFADSHVPLERDEIEDVAADLEKLAGFKAGDLFDRRGGFALKTIPGDPFADPATVLRARFRDGWTDGEGERHEGALAGGTPDLTRMIALLRDDGTADEKATGEERRTMEKNGRTDRPNH